MTREEAIREWTFRSNYIKKWLDEYGEEPSIRHYVELIDMAIEALSAEPKRVLLGYCKGANCKWWNPQVEGCNRCVFVNDEYCHTSADIVERSNNE